jgi:hypothetical protein
MGEYGIREGGRRSREGEEGDLGVEHREDEVQREAEIKAEECPESEVQSTTEEALEEALEELRNNEARERRVSEMVEEALSELEETEKAEESPEAPEKAEDTKESPSPSAAAEEEEGSYGTGGELAYAVQTEVRESEAQQEACEEPTEGPEVEKPAETEADQESPQPRAEVETPSQPAENEPIPEDITPEETEGAAPSEKRGTAHSEMEEAADAVPETTDQGVEPQQREPRESTEEETAEEPLQEGESGAGEEADPPQEVSQESEVSQSSEAPELADSDVEETEPEEDLREDFRQRVEKILEAADPGEGYHVDPLSGKKIYRGSEFFPESEEEQARRRLRELFSNLSEEEQEYFKDWVRSQIRTEEDLQELLERFSHRGEGRAALDDPEVQEYLRGEREEVPKSLRGLMAMETERQWAREVVRASEPRREETEEREVDVRFRSHMEFEDAVQRHPHVKRGLSPESHEKCRQYFRVMAEDSTVPDKTIAERERLDERVVSGWRAGIRPKQVQAVERLEAARLAHEMRIPAEASRHRIAPEIVRQEVKLLADSTERTAIQLAGVLERIYRRAGMSAPETVTYAELYDHRTPLLDRELRMMAGAIRANRQVVETALNRRLGLDSDPEHEIRLAVTDGRLYYWYVDTGPDHWLNVLEDQKIYISKEDKMRLLDEATMCLHVRNGRQVSEHYLNDLLSQVTHLANPPANRVRRYGEVHYLDGEAFHFICDAIGHQTLYQEIPTHLGVSHRGRIENIKWPSLGEFRMKTYAIIESDGTLSPKGQLRYFEKNDNRRLRAVGIFQEFGDFEVKEYRGPSGEDEVVRVELPMAFGAMMKYWGVPEGDKAVHNKGLHEVIATEETQVKKHYLMEMVPEDGSISGRTISVTRHNVLHAGKKAKHYRETYEIVPVVTKEQIDFIRRHASPKAAYLDYETGDVLELPMDTIRAIAGNSQHPQARTAREVLQVVHENPNRLLVDEEAEIAGALGIRMKRRVKSLLYYRESGRLSLCNESRTASVDDALRWVLIAPPDHFLKMAAASNLVNGSSSRVKRVTSEIERDGLSVHPVWRDVLE